MMKKLFLMMVLAGTVGFLSSCNSSTEQAADTEQSEKSSKCGQGKCGGDCDGDEDAKEEKTNDYFNMVDGDADGNITLAEFKAHAEQDYAEKDKDASGDICSKECIMFDKFNTDGDDKLSLEEFVNGHETLFSSIDTDADGNVTQEEWKAFSATVHEKADAEGKHEASEKCGH